MFRCVFDPRAHTTQGTLPFISSPSTVPDTIAIPLPVSSNDIRRYKEGTNALINLIPTPTVHKHKETDTAYVLLNEVLSLYLPYGILVSCKDQNDIVRKYVFNVLLFIVISN